MGQQDCGTWPVTKPSGNFLNSTLRPARKSQLVNNGLNTYVLALCENYFPDSRLILTAEMTKNKIAKTSKIY